MRFDRPPVVNTPRSKARIASPFAGLMPLTTARLLARLQRPSVLCIGGSAGVSPADSSNQFALRGFLEFPNKL
jgi:hypothetical protein